MLAAGYNKSLSVMLDHTACMTTEMFFIWNAVENVLKLLILDQKGRGERDLSNINILCRRQPSYK
jgi:hypothetical protein